MSTSRDTDGRGATRASARARIVLHPNGRAVVTRLREERAGLRARVDPLESWFAQFAQGYRERREALWSVLQGGGDYWPTPLFAQHLQEMAYHFGQAEEMLHATSHFLEQHEAEHPLVQSLLDHLPEHEILYGPLFLYTWLPVSAWVGDLQLIWWDGPTLAQLRQVPRCFQCRQVAHERRYTRGGLETLLRGWCEGRGKDPAQFPILDAPDGRSASLQGYVPRTIDQYLEWTAHNHFMRWAGSQPLAPVRLEDEGSDWEGLLFGR